MKNSWHLLLFLFVNCLSFENGAAQDALMQFADTIAPLEEMAPSTLPAEDTILTNQQKVLQQSYEQETIEEHSFNKETWKKATEGLDYRDKRKKQEEKAKSKEPVAPAFNISQQTLRLIAFVILFAVLIAILLKAFGVNIFLGRKKKKTEKTFSVEEFDDHIPESELDRLLRESLEQHDFRLAVRIYYLMAIKELSHRKLIHWRKEKTNTDYLTELREGTSYHGFNEITLIFERVWYGELAINEHRFAEMSERFKYFINSVKAIP